MKLYCMEDEVSIAGSVAELQEAKSKIEAIEDGKSIELKFDTSGNSEGFGALESTMIVQAGNGPAFAEYKEGLGVIFIGNVDSLKVFASFFDFEIGSELGCHYHWDEACDSNYVASGTLPIVVAVA